MLLTLLAFLIVLGPLIFVHELGHFLVAKAVGIQVLRFSLGFGRPLIAWTRGETEYWISWIPLGGYVKMAGLEEEGAAGELEGGKSAVPIDPARSFDRKPLWARMAVIVAGVTMNLLFACAIYAALTLSLGESRLALVPVDSVDARRLPAGAQALATLRHGEQITHIDGDTVATWNELQDGLLGSRERGAGSRDTVTIRVADRADPIVLRFDPEDHSGREMTVRALRPLLPARIGVVTPGHPAAKAGLRGGDVVVRAGADTVRSWDEMVRTIRRSHGQALDLAVWRGDSLVMISVTPVTQTETDSSGREVTFGLIGATPDPRLPSVRVPAGPVRAIVGGVEQTAWQVGAIAVSVKRLIFREASTRELGGPILIAQMSGQMLRLGAESFLRFLAFFSVSLAVLNMLPIPVLDGGHAMFLLIEAIRRKPLSMPVRMRLTQVGLLLVLAIMVLALSNDVLRVFR
ncbi:MAG: RIP metalloprotease RseP [Gemmatimonadales bacterium]|nr:RIP metalloprotease RseP [Gemmatimonadales bacterium]